MNRPVKKDLFEGLNHPPDEIKGQKEQSASQFTGETVQGSPAPTSTSDPSITAINPNLEIGLPPLMVAKEQFDPKVYPATALARVLQLKCRCDDCDIDKLVCSLKDGPPDADTKDIEQAKRQRRRAILAPGNRKWVVPTAHEISWVGAADGRARLLLLANYGCAHIRMMVREHRNDSMAGLGLPDVDALEAAWRAVAREKRRTNKYRPRPKRRRINKDFDPFS